MPETIPKAKARAIAASTAKPKRPTAASRLDVVEPRVESLAVEVGSQGLHLYSTVMPALAALGDSVSRLEGGQGLLTHEISDRPQRVELEALADRLAALEPQVEDNRQLHNALALMGCGVTIALCLAAAAVVIAGKSDPTGPNPTSALIPDSRPSPSIPRSPHALQTHKPKR